MANSKRRCVQCKKYSPVDDQLVMPNKKRFCDRECAVRYGIANKEKGKRIKHREQRRAFKANDVASQLKLTQKSFNKLRVLQELKWFNSKGIEPYCISCGKTNMDWCCGHYKTVGSQGRLRFDDKNTYLQCNRYCNMALSGNISGNKSTHGYTEGLILRFGAEAAGGLIDYCETNTAAKKWSGKELKELRLQFNKEIKELL